MTNFAILIPAYQPDSKLNKLIKDITLDPYFQNVQIVVVDDGSGIEYDPIFNAISSSTSLIRYDKNEGKGFALKTGFKFIKDHLKSVEAVVTIDADGQHTVGDTKKCLQEYERNAQKYPLILGSRNFGKNIPLRSKIGNLMTRDVLSLSLGLDISDTQTGLRVIPTTYFDKMILLEGNRYEFEMQMLLFAKENNVPIIEVPIETIYINENESSHFNPIMDSIKIYKTFLKFILSSASSFIVDISAFSLIVFLIGNQHADTIFIASFLSRFLSSLFNFMMNKAFVFQKGDKTSILKYFMLVIGQISVSALLVTLGNHLFPGVQLSLVKVVVDTILFMISYKIQKKYIFTKKAGI